MNKLLAAVLLVDDRRRKRKNFILCILEVIFSVFFSLTIGNTPLDTLRCSF